MGPPRPNEKPFRRNARSNQSFSFSQTGVVVCTWYKARDADAAAAPAAGGNVSIEAEEEEDEDEAADAPAKAGTVRAAQAFD